MHGSLCQEIYEVEHLSFIYLSLLPSNLAMHSSLCQEIYEVEHFTVIYLPHSPSK